MNNSENTIKQAYESISCSVTEVESQGVLCASNSGDGGSLSGGLDFYVGRAL